MPSKETPHYVGHRQRLKDKLLRDGRGLADYELLELFLALVIPRRDTKPLAKDILARFGSLKDALTARPDQLTEIKGVGPSAAAQWALFQELSARVGEAQTRSGTPLSDPADVAKAAMARIGAKGTEEFWCAFLDAKNRVIAWERVSRGTVNATPVFPREIAAAALRLEAVSLILCHNHPGGDPRPSREDAILTDKVREAVAALDIAVLDHIVVTDHDYYSFNEHGRL